MMPQTLTEHNDNGSSRSIKIMTCYRKAGLRCCNTGGYRFYLYNYAHMNHHLDLPVQRDASATLGSTRQREHLTTFSFIHRDGENQLIDEGITGG